MSISELLIVSFAVNAGVCVCVCEVFSNPSQNRTSSKKNIKLDLQYRIYSRIDFKRSGQHRNV